MTDPIKKYHETRIPPEMAGKRLDHALAALFPDMTRAFLRKLLDNANVLLDNAKPKPAHKLKGGEQITIHVPEATPIEAEAEDIPLNVLYEDDDLIVIDKRPGMVAHPSPGHRDGTLVNALLHHYGDSLSGIGGALRPGIVHRLDKDTSGCLVAAKNDATHHKLIRQFMERSVEKQYLAITLGVPKPVNGTIEGQMGRSKKNRKLHAMLHSGGKHSLTMYTTLENYGALALVRCNLKTGRTHQARVHMAHAGAPVLCDKDYGNGGEYTTVDMAKGLALFQYGQVERAVFPPFAVLLSRQALHAWRLAFDHPSDGRRLEFEAPLPDDMARVLSPFRNVRENMT
jgi:pseudouridine synthase, RluA family